MLMKYLDPIFYTYNENINLLLAEKRMLGFYKLSLDFDMVYKYLGENLL